MKDNNQSGSHNNYVMSSFIYNNYTAPCTSVHVHCVHSWSLRHSCALVQLDVHVYSVHSLLHSCLQAKVAVADFTVITCIVVWLIKAVIISSR